MRLEEVREEVEVNGGLMVLAVVCEVAKCVRLYEKMCPMGLEVEVVGDQGVFVGRQVFVGRRGMQKPKKAQAQETADDNHRDRKSVV